MKTGKMASEDVIELGSSDDEAEPAPKKIKVDFNTKVQIPSKCIVIKPVKPALPPLQKVLAGGAVTVKNIRTGKVTLQTNKLVCGRPVQKLPQKIIHKLPMIKPVTFSSKHLQIQNNMAINPLNFVSNQQNIKIHNPNLKLPPGITVKRMATAQKKFSVINANKKKQFIGRKTLPEKIITTVEIDDEIPIISGTGPQWYIRPEEQTEHSVKQDKQETKGKQDVLVDTEISIEVPNKQETNDKQDSLVDTEISIEVANNTEPTVSNYVTIMIEDSPVKPVQLKTPHDTLSQLAITIDDSPSKAIKEQSDACDSDGEKQSTNTPHSKKKLEYPKEDENKNTTDTCVNVIVDLNQYEQTKEKQKVQSEGEDTKVIIKTRNPQLGEITKEAKLVKEVEKSHESFGINEFSPAYQKFIDLCFELENSEDMKKIVEKKIKTYYRQCLKEYVESEEFTDMVLSKICAMKAAPDKMYLYIKDIVDELNLLRKTTKAVEVSNKEYNETDSNNAYAADDNAYDSRRQRQIRKLDKTIKKLHRAIQKLEEQEVEFDDEEDSVYLLTERYKERLIKVHTKFCQLTNTKMPSEARIQLEARPGQPTGPVRRLEKWINKKVPIGKPLPFPDFHDVLRCVREANDEDKLGWNEADIMDEARDLFVRCGKKLQRRRQENEWRIAASRISSQMSAVDPADESEVLKKKLEENKTLAAKQETDVLNKYADKQNLLKLVAEEIGDKEAEESPVESEDDEVNDNSDSLENKQKRKECLKRLLHEKSKKMSVDKDHISNDKMKGNKEFIDDKEDNKHEKEKNKNMQEPSIPISVEKEVNIRKDSDTVVHSQTLSIAKIAISNEEKQEKRNQSDIHDFDSDIDELHLLQKLYSENEINSSHESDSDTPIAISDTLDSESETDKVEKQCSVDIISIENSSYSESEDSKEECFMEVECVKSNTIDCFVPVSVEKEISSTSICKVDEYDENILLASSDEENDNIGNIDEHHIKCNSITLNDKNTIKEDVVSEKFDSYEINNVANTNECILQNKDKSIMTCKESDQTLENVKEDVRIAQGEIKFQTRKSIGATKNVIENEHNCQVISSTNDGTCNEDVALADDCVQKNIVTRENYVSNDVSDNNTKSEVTSLNNDQLQNVTTGKVISQHTEDNPDANVSLPDGVLFETSNSCKVITKEQDIEKDKLIEDIEVLDVR